MKPNYKPLIEKLCKKYKIKFHYTKQRAYASLDNRTIYIPKPTNETKLFIFFHELSHIINSKSRHYAIKSERHANDNAIALLRKEGFKVCIG